MTIDEFKKVELRVGKVLEAVRVEGSDKLLRLKVDLGEKDATEAPVYRQILAGIGKAYEPEAMIGREVCVVANLDPREMMGFTSQGMLLAATAKNGLALSGAEGPVLLMPEKPVSPGAKIG